MIFIVFVREQSRITKSKIHDFSTLTCVVMPRELIHLLSIRKVCIIKATRSLCA